MVIKIEAICIKQEEMKSNVFYVGNTTLQRVIFIQSVIF